jgi:hypothetical protein
MLSRRFGDLAAPPEKRGHGQAWALFMGASSFLE